MAVDIPEPEVVAFDIESLLNDILTEEDATTSSESTVDFRIEINCQKGNHYMRTRRGSGTRRRKGNSANGKESYRYDGIADVVATERQGYYGARWQEYKHRHECHYEVQESAGYLMGYLRSEDGPGSLAGAELLRSGTG